ncbi:MAG: hypothetical protein QGI86_01225 [Candidatus Poribacteria bacterium]|nr:hypothetical protein [Candidatus Poribacteria bacterium]MDP6745881.1 hypothetical protein [Candidatus Poribacteria bacterium]MDP6997249.1 hypothetical protein [Candidatus Poribacteria bacterium]
MLIWLQRPMADAAGVALPLQTHKGRQEVNMMWLGRLRALPA